MDSDGRGRQAGTWGAETGKEVGEWAKVLVEITSSTSAPRSIATIEVKAPWGEETKAEEEAEMNNNLPPLMPAGWW